MPLVPDKNVHGVLGGNLIDWPLDVLEVQGRVNLVHDVEGRGLVVVESEHQGEGGQGILHPSMKSLSLCFLLPLLIPGANYPIQLGHSLKINLEIKFANICDMNY